MTRLWIGCTSPRGQEELERALAYVKPGSRLVFARDAADARCRLRDEEPGTVGAIVGLSESGVSDVNLAAAIASDGLASEVVLVVREASGSLRSRAAQAGVSRVIELDEVPEEELMATAPLAGRPRVAPTDGDGHAPVVVLASGRGGVGKSAIVAIMACVAAHWGMRVALLDLDLACGNLYASFGMPNPSDLASLLGEDGQLVEGWEQEGLPCHEGITLWGPCALPEMAERAMPLAAQLIDRLSVTYGLVLVDTSSTCTDAVAQAMQMADRLVLVQDCAPGAVASLARMSALAVRLGVARTRIVRVENGCNPRELERRVLPRAEVGLETARVFRIPDAGDELCEQLSEGHVEELRSLGGDAVARISLLLASLLRELGSLPESEEAQRAADPRRGRGPRRLFGRRREVA